MSKPLSAEWHQKIDDEALELTKRFKDNNDYQAGCIQGFQDGYSKGSVVYGTLLVEAQERVEKLEAALKAISKFEEAHWAAHPDIKLTKIFKLSNEALSPDNKLKEDEDN